MTRRGGAVCSSKLRIQHIGFDDRGDRTVPVLHSHGGQPSPSDSAAPGTV